MQILRLALDNKVLGSIGLLTALAGRGQLVGLLLAIAIARLYLPDPFGVLSVVTSVSVMDCWRHSRNAQSKLFLLPRMYANRPPCFS